MRYRAALLGAGTAAALVLAAACSSGVTGQPAARPPSRAPSSATRTAGPTSAAPHGATAAALSQIRHVWIIALENESYSSAFGSPAADPELARVLPGKGALLTHYYAIGHASLDNYIAQISGQAPDSQTSGDCTTYSPFVASGHLTGYGQLPGNGCVYPASVPTVAGQLSAAHLSWKSYNQQMGTDPSRDGTIATAHGPACGHPVLGAADPTDISRPANDSYATRHDPFVYFESITGSRAYCGAHVVSFQPLATDLRSAATTPNYSWITPDTCADGHDSPCQDGAPGGLSQVDSFLATWVPRIMASPAYRTGLIVITFDEAAQSDSSACCGETASASASHPNAAAPGVQGPGGGRVGAVLLSPFIRPGTVSTRYYNHYSLLKTVELIFGLNLLGDASQPQVHAFGTDVFASG